MNARRRPGKMWLSLVGVFGAVCLVTLVLAFGLSRDPLAHPSSLEGHPAPDFTLTTLDGSRAVHLAALKGQVVVVNFWASWCAECHAEHPALADAWDRYRDQGVVFVGISFQDSVSAASAYAQAQAVSWPLLADPTSSTGLAFGISGVPETVVIARDGRVASKLVGPVTYPTLTERITPLLDGPAA